MESLNKQTYANNANITAIFQNSIVYKECKIHHTSLTPKIMRKILRCRSFIRAHYAESFNIITFSNFLGNFCNNGKLSVFKQQAKRNKMTFQE